MQKINYAFLVLGILIFAGCNLNLRKKKEAHTVSQAPAAEWIKDAVIYEVDVRQYTTAGTFEAFSEHLPRLHDLGIEILWFMLIYTIGVENRKGTLESY